MKDLPSIFPKDINPEWLKIWYESLGMFKDQDAYTWIDIHKELIDSIMKSSDAAKAFQQNIFAHLNAARHIALRQCLRIVKKNYKNPEIADKKIQAMLKEIEYPKKGGIICQFVQIVIKELKKVQQTKQKSVEHGCIKYVQKKEQKKQQRKSV